MPLTGLRVLSLESRRAKEMETLIAREGGIPFVAPSVKERALEDDDTALRFVERLEAGEFDMVICMTAVGLTYLRDSVVPSMPVERLSEALRRATIVSRGPKARRHPQIPERPHSPHHPRAQHVARNRRCGLWPPGAKDGRSRSTAPDLR